MPWQFDIQKDLMGKIVRIDCTKPGRIIVGKLIGYYGNSLLIALENYTILERDNDGNYTPIREGNLILMQARCWYQIEEGHKNLEVRK